MGVIHGKTDFHRYLPVRDLSLFYVATGIGNLEPPDLMNRFRGPFDGVFNGLLYPFLR